MKNNLEPLLKVHHLWKKKGSPLLRKFCYDNGFLIIVSNPCFRTIYDYHKLVNGKSHTQAIFSTMGKIVPVLYRMLANMEEYNVDKIKIHTREKDEKLQYLASKKEKQGKASNKLTKK